jgi:hypothetical protein
MLAAAKIKVSWLRWASARSGATDSSLALSGIRHPTPSKD